LVALGSYHLNYFVEHFNGPFAMTCAEIFANRPIGRVRFERFSQLHPDGKRLIKGWFERGWAEFDRNPDNVFEPFIFLWFAFNGWASCVTDRDRDFEIIDALLTNGDLRHEFSRLVAEQNSCLGVNARGLARLLPIFDARSLTRQLRSVPAELRDDRRAHVEYYIQHGMRRYDPACWKRHIETEGELPIDWPHMLKPIYKIRCNLFHGQKAAHSEMDRRIVQAAFLTLGHFIKDIGIFEAHAGPFFSEL
jgi:hypothetical protein